MTISHHIKQCPTAIFFDMDGVLIDSEAIHWNSVVQLLDTLSIPKSKQPAQRTGWSDGSFWAEMKESFSLQEDVATLTSMRERIVLSLFETQGLPLKPTVLALLCALETQYPQIIKCVVSASPIHQIQESLNQNHISHFFKQIWSGHHPSRRNKPFPDPYLTCAQSLGLEMSSVWIVEDSAPGLTAALAARPNQVIAMPSADCPKEIYEQADIVIKELIEIIGILRTLN
jgi:beta-phosphoglucomutase-like phosphatase (HAD superfamily)